MAPVVGLLLAPLTKDAAFFNDVALPLVVMTFLTTLAAAAALLKARRASEQRNLLQASINQAPDYLYVTDVQSRFVEADRSTLRTTLREIFSSRQIALIGLPSTKCARRILAIVSTTSIP